VETRRARLLMTTNQIIILAISLIFALILGPLTARSSARREPIYGGLPAHIFHVLGSMAFVALVPTVLTGIILGEGLAALPYAVALLVTSLLSVFIFAIIEKPARQRNMPKAVETDVAWTAEDAARSGL
jgi:hypothetical protein